MRYKILKDGEVINTIIADEDFCKTYCNVNGYTYEAEPEPTPEPEPEPEPEPTETTVYDELDAAYQEGVSSAYDS